MLLVCLRAFSDYNTESSQGNARGRKISSTLVSNEGVSATLDYFRMRGNSGATHLLIVHLLVRSAAMFEQAASICIGLRASAFRAISCGSQHTPRTAYRRHQPSGLGSWIGPPCKPSLRHPEALEQISTSQDYLSGRASHSRKFVPGSTADWWTQLAPGPRSLRPANLRRCLPRDLSPSRDPARGQTSRPLDCRFARRKPRLMPDTGRPALTGSNWTEPVTLPLAVVRVAHLSKPFAPANMGPTLPAL